jgi:citrate lyase subunit beta/citryl-CoA lyase
MVALISLFVPGDRPERFAKAAGSGADAIIIDLEDAVGVGAKEQARLALQRPGLLPAGVEVFVRINQPGSLWHEADIDALAGLQLTGIMLPKKFFGANYKFRRKGMKLLWVVVRRHVP